MGVALIVLELWGACLVEFTFSSDQVATVGDFTAGYSVQHLLRGREGADRIRPPVLRVGEMMQIAVCVDSGDARSPRSTSA